MQITYIKGDLIELTLQGKFDVIAHGCNCFCTMGAGIAVAMKETFGCDTFELEDLKCKRDINKLGTIDYEYRTTLLPATKINVKKMDFVWRQGYHFAVINAYTQYSYGKNHVDGTDKPIDYSAITLCMRKINHMFRGATIGLPKIGAGLAGGDWDLISRIIETELKDLKQVIVVEYDK